MSSGIFAYVGCYTTLERHAHGTGINVYHVDDTLTTWHHLQTMHTMDNPSFLSLDRSGRFLCAVHGDRNYISAYAINRETGLIEYVSGAESGGMNPVHLLFDPENKYIVIPNYASGSVTSISFDKETGTLGAVLSTVQLPGEPGPHRIEQHCSHPHGVTYDPAQRFIYIPDKGLDCIFIFKLQGGYPQHLFTVPTREGAGPRHIAFHTTEPYAYVINELDCTVTAYKHTRETGELTPIQTILALPDYYTGNSRGAEIATTPDGTAIIVSLRGANLLSIFALDKKTGELRHPQSTSSGGMTPRFFSISPAMSTILVANESSDTIGRISFNAQGFDIAGVEHCTSVESPSCIVLKTMKI
ncbi:lactonase family protein [Gluconobacter wancherniae]|uniref:lactonase family protein n=1 Tax=Gluconobacter wancherniae TaxID=1307955 RepID=UPI001B8D00D9|nr:lactonase family protein [Gluconobacter wancherniae]MBS1095665.1 lactonase family protein [Gluconobacter wancherniae]